MRCPRIAGLALALTALMGWCASDAGAAVRCGAVRDDFNRANSSTAGPLWLNKRAGMVIAQNKLTSTVTPAPAFPKTAGPTIYYAGSDLPYERSVCVDIFGGTEPGAYVRVGFASVPDKPFLTRAYATISDSKAPFDGNFDKIQVEGNDSVSGEYIIDTGGVSSIPPAATGRFQVSYSPIGQGDWTVVASIDTDFDGAPDRSSSAVLRGGSLYGPVALGAAGGATIDNLSTPSAQPVVQPANTGHGAENGPSVAVDPGVLVTDADDASLMGATVQAMGPATLSFANTAQISGTLNTTATTLQLSGTATVAQYQAALRTVRFVAVGKNPPAQMGFGITVDDGDTTSAARTSTATVDLVNDPPVVVAAATALTYPEKAPPLIVDPALSSTDPEEGDLAGATVRIASGLEPGDKLTWAGATGITGSYSGGLLTLTGTAKWYTYEDALRSVAFSSTNNAPKLSKVIEFQITDGALLSNKATRTVLTTSIDDAPIVKVSTSAVLSSSGRPLQVVRAGDAAGIIDAAVTVADADDTAVEHATVNLAGAVAGELLSFSPGHGITGSFASGMLTLTGSASLTDYQDVLRSVAFTPDVSQVPAANHLISFTVNDGEKDSAPAQREIVVQPLPGGQSPNPTGPLPDSSLPLAGGPITTPTPTPDATTTPLVLLLDQAKLKSKRLARKSKGNQVSFRVNAGATLSFVFTRKKLRVSFTKTFAAAGSYDVPFKARVGKKTLTRGTWKLTLTATAAGQKASSATVTVSVV